MWEERLRVELQLLRRNRDSRKLLPIEEDGAPYVRVGSRRLIDFANWDVFDLASRRDFKKSLHEFAARGSGRISLSRGGWTKYHRAAESSLASFLGCEDVLLLSSRNQAIFSFVLNTITDQDLLYVDEALGATPVLDAAAVGGIPVVPYTAQGLEGMTRRISQSGLTTGERLVWTQGFNLELGLASPIDAIERIARSKGGRIVVDETFTLGLMGPHLGGIIDYHGLQGVPAATVGGIGPALGVSGGIIAGSANLCEVIRLRSPAVHKEAPLSVGTAASIPVAIELLRGLTGEVERVLDLCRYLELGLGELGFEVRSGGRLPIVSVVLPASLAGYRVWEVLLHSGIWCDFDESVLRSAHTPLIRFVLNVRHDREQIKRVIEVMGGSLAVSSVLSRVEGDLGPDRGNVPRGTASPGRHTISFFKNDINGLF